MNTHYSPIDCDFYDVLEEASTLRQHCEIVYVADEQSEATVRGYITNLYAASGEEFLVMDDGLRIRLDALVRLNGNPIPGTEQMACS
ncbi:MAG: hypothetical protein H9535_07170 [Ignavibacteria bacterium]|nr:hypothetical protein [Ignavibacteria bacterium]